MTALNSPAPTPFLIVFGRDQAGKPHASWFDAVSAELATKAAGLMNMHAAPIQTDELRELAGQLPRGRVFSSGKAFTPFINGKLYTRLVELTRDVLGLAANESAAGQQASAPKQDGGTTAAPAGGSTAEASAGGTASDSGGGAPKKRPTSSEQIGVGSVVLATVGPGEGWFEAEVIGLNGAMLTLKWCDYAEPTIVRRRHELGLLPPIAA